MPSSVNTANGHFSESQTVSGVASPYTYNFFGLITLPLVINYTCNFQDM